MIEKFGRVDGILFHQGENDNVENVDKYYYDSFVEFLENLESSFIKSVIFFKDKLYFSYIEDKRLAKVISSDSFSWIASLTNSASSNIT